MAAGGTSVFDCSGTITLTHTIVIGSGASVSLDGNGNDVSLGGADQVRLFQVNGNLTLRDLGLKDGAAVGAGGADGAAGADGVDGVDGSGTNGTPGSPGTGGSAGASADGGALWIASGGVATAIDCDFESNSAQGGAGGYGGGGGNGGFGGVAAQGHTGGNGAKGGDAGAGGSGGMAQGGAVYNGGQLTLIDDSFLYNSVIGGRGGHSWYGGNGGNGGGGGGGSNGGTPGVGGNSGAGGDGGAAMGGAIYNSGSLSIAGSSFSGNYATAGSGEYAGNAGSGGMGGNGGDGIDPGSGPGGNASSGADGGHAGSGGKGADALGGDIYNASSLQISDTGFADSTATAGWGGEYGGYGGDGGAGGNGGNSDSKGGNGGNGGNGGYGGNGGNSGNAIGGAIYSTTEFVKDNLVTFTGGLVVPGTPGGGHDGGGGGAKGSGGISTGKNGQDGTPGTHGNNGSDGVAGTVSNPDVFGEALSGATYHAITPTRVLDTRNGTGGLSGPFTNHAARTFQVTGGSSGVPAGAIAVTGNLTVTGQTSSGYLFIGPAATNNPTSSTLNFPLGDDRANAVTVALGTGGTLSITFVAPSNGPTAHAIFDVTGYFTPDTSGATYHAVSPTRALDTRNGTGGLSGPFTNHVARTFTVSGVPSGAVAVTGNLTVTGQTSSGYLFIGPTATNNPTSSTLNFPLGDDRANAVTVALGTGGTLSITFVAPSNGPSAHAIFDVTGYFTADMSGATYVPLSPTRDLDTRNGTGGLSGPFTNHAARTFTLAGVPSTAVAVTGNLTVTGQTSSGYLFIGPTATNNPGSSTLNFPKGDDRANAVTVALGTGGTLSITFVAPSNGPSAQAIFDLTGYFVPAGG